MRFQRIPPALRQEAYQWHRGFALADNHLFPRTRQNYANLLMEGAVWCAMDDNDDFCAMAYYAEDDGAWEIGGLMVAASQQQKGVGSIMMRLALGTVLTELDPLSAGQRVITHVHAENQKPKALIEEALHFSHSRMVRIPGASLPGLKTDAEGFVNGDEFQLMVPDSVEVLADWCERWSGRLRDGTPAAIALPLGLTLRDWAADLREMIA